MCIYSVNKELQTYKLLHMDVHSEMMAPEIDSLSQENAMK